MRVLAACLYVLCGTAAQSTRLAGDTTIVYETVTTYEVISLASTTFSTSTTIVEPVAQTTLAEALETSEFAASAFPAKSSSAAATTVPTSELVTRPSSLPQATIISSSIPANTLRVFSAKILTSQLPSNFPTSSARQSSSRFNSSSTQVSFQPRSGQHSTFVHRTNSSILRNTTDHSQEPYHIVTRLNSSGTLGRHRFFSSSAADSCSKRSTPVTSQSRLVALTKAPVASQSTLIASTSRSSVETRAQSRNYAAPCGAGFGTFMIAAAAAFV